MSKNHYVLRALKILGLEEILKLAETVKAKRAVPMKKAAGGEDLVVWNEPDEPAPRKAKRPEAGAPQAEAKVINFPARSAFGKEPEPTKPEEEETPIPNFVSSEMMLWQKELTKDSEGILQKQDAFKGYKKSTEMYIVKSSDIDGKEKMRIASTQGVLVNKKQA